ncbi:hypothetical protein B0H16DRAFT_1717819 [Mycena metata]|uniref:Fucose-specific lectin n=1 Tax=Mycena metata TaxID=1033252 RepID=A0AAD7JI11_9AGAR|nr:hypothetical protein B0H16DRAFT_1717819 [Mycena metata]
MTSGIEILPADGLVTFFVIPAGAGATVPSEEARPTSEIIPVSFVGGAAAVQAINANGDSRIYYQDYDNSIQEIAVNGPLTTGRSTGSSLRVPANEVLAGTPIAATTIAGNDLQQIHVYFLSPDYVLSEYAFGGGIWQGGPNCTDCLTANGLVVQRGSEVLYALGSLQAPSGTAFVRVGFVSAGAPSTLSEAVWSPGVDWQVAQLN